MGSNNYQIRNSYLNIWRINCNLMVNSRLKEKRAELRIYVPRNVRHPSRQSFETLAK